MENYNSFPPAPENSPAPLQNKFLEIGRSGKNQWWRYLVGVIIVMIGGYVIIGQIPISALAIWAISKKYINPLDPDVETKILNPAVMHVDANLLFMTELFIFVGAMFALWLTVRFLHRKKFLSIITSAPKIRWKRFAISAAIWMILSFIGQFISMSMYPDNYVMVFNLKPFLITILIALIFLPIQTWFEEFFFRGYIFQGIGIKTKTAIVPIIITGLLFAGAHMFNPEVQAYGIAAMLPAYLLPGIFLAMMAALDEGLESAMGMHFANNFFGTFAVTTSSSAIQANTIWVAKEMNPGADNLTLLISFFILMAILAKTNKWDFSKLYR
jgi:membrane protease YdiL (CAAX protease family)